jgi:hypothetical protein
MRALRLLLALAPLVASTLALPAQERTPRPTEAGPAADVLVGAIRWDNWRLDSAHAEVLDDPALRARIPYFAMRLPDGKLGFPGDLEHVLHADVRYARAGGLDYFIFGYYLDTGSWRRDKTRAQALNRAFRSYLNLPDRAGVRFALSFNYSFPAEDIDDVSDVIISVVDHPDHVRTHDGALPVFFFTPNVGRWAEGLGGDEKAAAALAEIRDRVARATGNRLYTIALLFRIGEGGPRAIRMGFDALSTYANGTGPGGKAVPYAACAASARRFWKRAGIHPAGFLPTVSMGWDYRPMLKRPQEQAHRDPNPSWCESATDAEWSEQVRLAVGEAAANPRNGPFKSVVVYAWNEFSEGGWLAPTVGEGTRRVDVLARALGRARSGGPIRLTWPARLEPQSCDVRSNPRTLAAAGSQCRVDSDSLTMDWPCPPRLGVARDVLRSPSGGEALLHGRAWQERVCEGPY